MLGLPLRGSGLTILPQGGRSRRVWRVNLGHRVVEVVGVGVLRVNPTRCHRCPMVTQLLLLLSTRIAVVGGCRTLLLARGPAATAAAEIKFKKTYLDITHSVVRSSAFWLCEKKSMFQFILDL